MFRAIVCTAAVLFLSTINAADDQKLPPTIKAGADFVWHVAHSDTVKESLDVGEIKVTVDLDKESEVALKKMIVDLKKIRPDLEPSVAATKQKFSNGEMDVVYVLSSSQNVVRYYRLHIVDVSQRQPPTITGIEELSWRDVLDGKYLRIAQKEPIPE